VKRLTFITLLLISFTHVVPSGAADIPFEFADGAQEERYKALLAELRCLVCQNQSLADSNADLAQDLRAEVYRMVKAGNNNEAIIAFLVARYGDFVLYRPPMKSTTYLLWFGPALLLVVGALVLVRYVRRRGAQAHTALTAEEHKEVGELLQHNDTERKSG
jgi:cytochrome c-type biogenesis protein CcmH